MACNKDIGIDEGHIQAVKSLYERRASDIKVGNTLLNEFSVSKGLKQGCSLAPLLFTICLEISLMAWKHRCYWMGLPIGDETLYTLLFADDQVYISGDRTDAAYMLRILKQKIRGGLITKAKKTEYMSE